VLSVAQVCTDRDKAIHVVSKGHPEYDPVVTDKKASDTKGPYTCATFAGINGENCIGCPNKGKITSPVSLGAGSVLEAALPWEDDEEDKDDKKPKDTKGSDGSEHGGHSRATHLAKQSIPKIDKEKVNEMDKSQPSAGRDTGPRDGPDKEAKPVSKEKMTKDASDILTKSMSKEHKKEVKEGQDDLDRILQIMNHRR
jgi:hypothetical protein